MNDEYLIYGETLTAIADSIRSVSSVSTTWTPDEMAAYILANLVKPTTRQAAKTYTPGTSNQTIPAGTFLTGAATIAGDADLAVGNIKKGVNIFGMTGTLAGVWGDITKFYGFSTVKSGTFTLSSKRTRSDYVLTHNLGLKPRMFIMCCTNPAANAYTYGISKAIMGIFAMQSADSNYYLYNSVMYATRTSSGAVGGGWSIFTSPNYGAAYSYVGSSIYSTTSFTDDQADGAAGKVYNANSTKISWEAGASNTDNVGMTPGTYNWMIMG